MPGYITVQLHGFLAMDIDEMIAKHDLETIVTEIGSQHGLDFTGFDGDYPSECEFSIYLDNYEDVGEDEIGKFIEELSEHPVSKFFWFDDRETFVKGTAKDYFSEQCRGCIDFEDCEASSKKASRGKE